MDTLYRLVLSSIRCLGYLSLKFGPESKLTVLVGDGPAGRSAALEGLALAKAVMESDEALVARLGRFQEEGALRRRGCPTMVFAVMIGDERRKTERFINYLFGFAVEADGVMRMATEQLADPNEAKNPLFRSLGAYYMIKAGPQPAWRRERKAQRPLMLPIDKIVLHLPMPPTAAPIVGRLKQMFRRLEIVFDLNLHLADPARPDDAEARAANISKEWAAIQAEGEGSWQRALSLARVVLGPALGAVTLSPAGLDLSFAGEPAPIPAAALPQDQLTWLATIPLIFQQPHRSLLALDQPERQLSPLALATLIRELKRADTPVLITTESNVPLQLLDNPVEGLYVGRMLEPDRAAYYRPDPERTREALRRHGDLAWVRASGALDSILGEPEPYEPPNDPRASNDEGFLLDV